jgi:predicted nucleotidyltransferase
MLLRQYYEVGDKDRVFSLPAEVIEGVGYDIELSGAWMLGNDASRLSSTGTANRLKLTFSDHANLDRLVVDVGRALKSQNDPEGHARKLLEQFWAGFQQGNSGELDTEK